MSQGQDSAQEKHLPPTPKRLADAKKKGQVARSRELATLLVTLGGGAVVWLFGGRAVRDIRDYARGAFEFASEGGLPHLNPTQVVESGLTTAGTAALGAIAPILVCLVVLAVAGPLMTGGVIFRLESAAPKPSNINPLSGIKRMFSVKALVELAKAILKFALVITVAAIGFMALTPELMALGRQSALMGLQQIGGMMLGFFLLVSASLLVIAGIDVPFQLFQHRKKLRMSHQELRDEQKEVEGRPEVKQKIRSLQMQAARRELKEAVASATVVITNPTHYAVALRYDPTLAAPAVVARGAGVVAEEIRRLAAEHKLPLVSAPPLARSLFFELKEGEMVPGALYAVVARVIIYVMQLAETPGLRPPVIRDAEIPAELRHDPQ
ncbi:MAG: flagellar type III secretion system protein FlhB [Pseudomonadota bacterium]